MRAASSAIRSMPRSGIREIMDIAMGMPDCIRLEVGEPNFATAPHIIEAAHRAALEGHTRYTDNSGIFELRAALAEQAAESTDREVLPEQIIVTSGAMGALFSTLTCVLEPGDEVIVLSPSWPNYQMQLQLLGAVARVVETSPENGYLPTIQQLEEATNAATKALLINTPCNPTGAVIPSDLLNEITQFARHADLFLIADEVYSRITFEEPQIPTACYDTDARVVSINSFSKTYAMTGWRVGYAIAPASLAPLIRKCQEPTVGCVNAPAQYASLAALTGPQHLVEEMRNAYLNRRNISLEMLSQANVPVFTPGGAFYLWIDISQSGRTAQDFALDLIHNHQVAIVPGTTFGAENSDRVRISLASDASDLQEGLRRLISELER
ncbi:MAG TPA: aminotransferase class I/II [Gemmatimonadetes bacterium]|nr:aminotransferase class I/II [Gemmatimonadota bacterium]